MTFGSQLTQLVNANLESGVPPHEIVLVLEVTKFELVNTMIANRAIAREAQAADQAPKIVGLNGEKL